MNIKERINQIKQVIRIINNNKNRPKDKNGQPGSLLDFSNVKKKPIIVGDLHGSYNNLKNIVIHEDNLELLKKDKAMLIIIGDALHNDQTGYMMEMESSLKTIEYIFELIMEFKENVIYIKGNHDTFDDRLRKSGIAQGLEFKKYLLKQRSEEYALEMDNFFDALPYFIIGDGYVITHAAPIKGGITREDLINVKYDSYYYMQLLWNRIHEFRGNPNAKEYDGNDIKATLRKLKLPEDTPFIVGHNPMWQTGDRSGVWKDVLGIKNHYIIYTNIATNGPYITFNDNKLVVKFASPVEKKEVSYDR